MTIARALSAAAVVLGLLGLWLRLSRAPLPQAAAAPLPLRTAGQPMTAPAGATAAPRYEAIVAANIFSQTRAAPLVRFAPAGRAVRGTAAASRRPLVKLYGITVGPQGAIALIHADSKLPGAEIYRVGDLVAGARLVAITDSTVTLAQPSGPLILRLPSGDRSRP
jgi:hypothetical protein